jgi:hypothetical protein
VLDILIVHYFIPSISSPDSNSTDPLNSSNTTILDPDMAHIFVEDLYSNRISNQLKMFQNLGTNSGTLTHNKATDFNTQFLSLYKCQLMLAAGAFTGKLGTFFALYDSREINKIQSQILILSGQHNLLVDVVKKHKHQLNELAADLNFLTDIICTLTTHNPSLVYAKFEHNVKIVEVRLSVLFDTLQQLQH